MVGNQEASGMAEGSTPGAKPIVTHLWTHNDPKTINYPDYVLVFDDDTPPKEYTFTAIGDEQAIKLMQEGYQPHAWALYRIVDGQRHQVHLHAAEK